MMRRLREEIESSDRALARAAALVLSMPPLDTERLPRRAPPLARVERSGGVRRVRTALVVLVTTASAVAAASTLHTRWWRGRGGATQASQAPRLIDSHASRAAMHGAPSIAEATDLSVQSVPTAPHEETAGGPSLAVAPPGAASRHPTSAASRAPVRDVARDTAGTVEEDESALIMAAVRALRRDGDAARAEQLAEEALQRYPRGRQVEEAMALSMEAASARGDSSDAHRAAQRYLANFRSGRFADRALRILATSDR